MAEDTSDQINLDNADEPKGIKKLLANKIIVIGIAVVILLTLAAGAYFMLFSTDDSELPLEGEDTVLMDEEGLGENQNNEKIDLDIIPPDEEMPGPPIDPQLQMIEDLMKENLPEIEKKKAETIEPIAQEPSQEDLILLQQLEELKKQNEELKNYIKDRDRRAAMPEKDLSVPIEQMLAPEDSADTDSKEKVKPLYDNPYTHLDDYDDASNYYSSPYADDELVPAPSWGN